MLIPVGHTEQHGLHLPMNTDSVIIEAIAHGVVDAIPNDAVALPTSPMGSAPTESPSLARSTWAAGPSRIFSLR